VPQTGYEKWKNIQLNFNPTEMLRGWLSNESINLHFYNIIIQVYIRS
jgi:hypothetical protein